MLTIFGVTFFIYFSLFILRVKSAQAGPGLFHELTVGYIAWWGDLLRLDLGMSLKDHRPVIAKILERFPATLELNALTLIFSFLVAVPAAISAIYFKNRFCARFFSFLSLNLFSIPNFWIALVLSIFFGFQLGEITQQLFGFSFRFPISGMRSLEMVLNKGAYSTWEIFQDRVFHLILPVICSSLFNIALIYKFFYSELLKIMTREYIVAARARGIPEWEIITRHAGKNAIFPLITVFSLLIPSLLSSNFVIETIFSWPGIGRLGYDAILARDYPLVLGLALFTTMIVIGTNLLIEAFYFYFNPLLREGER